MAKISAQAALRMRLCHKDWEVADLGLGEAGDETCPGIQPSCDPIPACRGAVWDGRGQGTWLGKALGCAALGVKEQD